MMNANSEATFHGSQANQLELAAFGKPCFRDVRDGVVRKRLHLPRFPTRDAESTRQCGD
jgi:hypothetical protein